jgi:endonuclease YncB( thermonuclease family)
MAWLLALPVVGLVAMAAAPRPTHVLAVADAAHLDVETGGKPERLALIGVDASEGGPCGVQGAAYMRSLVLGKDVRVVTDTTVRDAAGAKLAYVFLPDGALLNERMLSSGYTRLGTLGANMAHAGVLVAAQTTARTHKRCLWAGERAQPGKPEVVKGLRLPLGGGGGGGPRFKNPLPPRKN